MEFDVRLKVRFEISYSYWRRISINDNQSVGNNILANVYSETHVYACVRVRDDVAQRKCLTSRGSRSFRKDHVCAHTHVGVAYRVATGLLQQCAVRKDSAAGDLRSNRALCFPCVS